MFKNNKKKIKVFDLASSKQIYESLKNWRNSYRTGYLLEHTSFSKISKFKNLF